MRSLTTCLVVAFAAALSAQDPGTSYLFRIDGPLAPAQHLALQRRFDVDCCGGRRPDGGIDVIVGPEEIGAFRALRLDAELVARGRPYHEIRAESVLTAPDAGYFTVAEVEAELDRLVATYPSHAAKVDLTTLPGAVRTAQNRSIWALRVSAAPNVDADVPAVVVAGQHHARELNSTVMVLGAAERVLAGRATDPQLAALVGDHELWFVPCANPDGTEHVWNVDNLWRKNRRPNGGSYGVDNNRNYPFLWGACGASSTASSDTYKGPTAGSEPENRALMALGRKVRPVLYLDFHSHGREVLFTYAPCANVDPVYQSFLGRYQDELAVAMRYGKRDPSASGESTDWHWAEHGTLGFLIEVMTSFQPTYAAARTEEARVWPGVRKALLDWRPAVRGHVRSVFQGQPIEAEIRPLPNLFQHGEVIRSRAGDGRYHAWLPVGSWQLEFRAPGYRTETRTVTVTTPDQPIALEVELEPDWVAASLVRGGSDRIGETATFAYASPGDAGDVYWIALSLGQSPGIPVGTRTIPLNADGAFFASATPGALLLGNLGVLPASETATATLPLPPLAFLVGLTLHAGGLTLAPGYTGSVKKFSPALTWIVRA